MYKAPSKERQSTILKYYQSGDYKKAKQLALTLTENFPNHPFGWKALSILLKKTGKISDSLDANQKIVQISPRDAEAHYNLGNTLKALDRLEESETSYRQAITLKPNFAEAHYNLGIIFKETGRLKEAEASYKYTIALKPNFADAYNNLGIILEQLSRLEEAEINYKQAIELKPKDAETYNNLGIILEQLGRLEEAEINYKQAIKLKPDFANAHRQLTLIKKFDTRDEQYLILQKLYLDEHIPEEKRCHINFSLAKIHEDLGNFKQAFKHYGEGNLIRKKKLKYNINDDIELFNQIKSNYPQVVKRSLKIKKNENDIIPVFIVGMPRSGTTLVEQIISSHSKVTGLGELPFVSQFGKLIARGHSVSNMDFLLKFRENYLNKLQNLSKGNLIITDKMPQNFYYIGLLAAAFPEAKILHVKRNPAATCWANYKQYFSSKNIGYCYSLDDIIKYYKLYEDLMNFWRESLTSRIYDLDYELLAVNQKDITKKIINHLDLNWEEKCLSPEDNKRSISTASNIQIRKKIYQGSSQQWKSYKPFLNGALDCLDGSLKL